MQNRRALLAIGLCVGAGAGAGAALLFRRSSPDTAGASSPDLAAAELQAAAQRGEMCSPRNATGVGLRGEYFSHANWQGKPALVRIDPLTNIDPASATKEGVRSARWSGWVKAPMTGRYRFHVEPTAARVVVGRQAVAGDASPADASVEMAAGRFYPIVIEVGSIAPDAGRLKLEWTAPHGARYAVPPSLLYLPTDSVGKPTS